MIITSQHGKSRLRVPFHLPKRLKFSFVLEPDAGAILILRLAVTVAPAQASTEQPPSPFVVGEVLGRVWAFSTSTSQFPELSRMNAVWPVGGLLQERHAFG